VSVLDDLQTAKSQVATRLREITAERKPSYDIDGQRVSWGEYHRVLLSQLKGLSLQIEYEQADASSAGWEERTIAYT